jgi:ribosomal protein S18 acetylase RimI-like enzyme
MPFSIRLCRADEAEQLLSLWRAADAAPSVTDSLADIGRVMAEGSSFLLVAEVAGVVVGSIIGSFDGWRGHLYRLAVHPQRRRHGIARALVDAATDRLVQRGAVRIMAIVERDRNGAMRFWNAVGFAEDRGTVRFLRNVPRGG